MFEKFLWYDPQPRKEVVLTEEEKEYVARIKKVEGEK
ncbi:MAG: YARHG domain-containing protein [Verrucomicrobia bacterium]|nr:YARHG domain-containing protein [Verrucomicrobiota bacterium]